MNSFKNSIFIAVLSSPLLGMRLAPSKISGGGIHPVSEKASSFIESMSAEKQEGAVPNLADLLKGAMVESAGKTEPAGEKHDLTGLLNKLHQEMTVLKSLTNMAHALGVELPPLPFAPALPAAGPDSGDMMSKLAMIHAMVDSLKAQKAQAPPATKEVNPLEMMTALAHLASIVHPDITKPEPAEVASEIPEEGHPFIRLARLVSQLKEKLANVQASSLIQKDPAAAPVTADQKPNVVAAENKTTESAPTAPKAVEKPTETKTSALTQVEPAPKVEEASKAEAVKVDESAKSKAAPLAAEPKAAEAPAAEKK